MKLSPPEAGFYTLILRYNTARTVLAIQTETLIYMKAYYPQEKDLNRVISFIMQENCSIISVTEKQRIFLSTS